MRWWRETKLCERSSTHCTLTPQKTQRERERESEERESSNFLHLRLFFHHTFPFFPFSVHFLYVVSFTFFCHAYSSIFSNGFSNFLSYHLLLSVPDVSPNVLVPSVVSFRLKRKEEKRQGWGCSWGCSVSLSFSLSLLEGIKVFSARSSLNYSWRRQIRRPFSLRAYGNGDKSDPSLLFSSLTENVRSPNLCLPSLPFVLLSFSSASIIFFTLPRHFSLIKFSYFIFEFQAGASN